MRKDKIIIFDFYIYFFKTPKVRKNDFVSSSGKNLKGVRWSKIKGRVISSI